MSKFRKDQIEFTTFYIPEGGEANLIRNNDWAILVDCGGGPGTLPVNETLGEDLRDYFDDEDIVLTDLVASHNHHDHTNGFAGLLEEDADKFLADNVRYFHNGESMGKGVRNNLLPLLTNLGIEEKIVEHDVLELIEWTDVQDILMFKARGGAKSYRSIVMNIPFKNASFLLTGDLQKTQERNLYKDNFTSPYLRTDVLKISHHGSSDSTKSEFLNRSSPGIFISPSASDEGHQLEDDVIKRIHEYFDIHNFQFFEDDGEKMDSIFDTTDEEGVDISVRTDGVWRSLNKVEGIIFEVETKLAIHKKNE